MFYYILVIQDDETLIQDVIEAKSHKQAWEKANKKYNKVRAIFQTEEEKNILLNRLKNIFNVIRTYKITNEEQAKMLVKKGIWDMNDYDDYVEEMMSV